MTLPTQRDTSVDPVIDEVSSFREFFERHQRGVFSLLRSLGPEETRATALAQEVFVRVWKERQMRSTEADRVVATYRYALVWGYSAAPRRPERRSQARPGQQFPGTRDEAQVREALAQLPEEERVILVLSRTAGLSPELVGRVLHDPERRVRHVLRQAWGHVAALLLPFIGG